ncbi:hypothetical protein SASPL_143847 [Salvia splendens]|uniref:Bulb-type lectin domain-containing protein n=1 Tax=Salvia splendens TaxID=180675 RepID=A0A8X8ZA47_SALSN|nr:hypothetical protein SASPL_143847 [Salvia splendens]
MLSRDIVDLPVPKQPVFAENDGNLVVLDGTNQTVWSTNLTTTSPVSLIVQIVDTGNLILREEATEDVLWESFSQPTDVLVQGMTLSQIGALIVSRIFPLEICMAWSVGLLLLRRCGISFTL